MRRIRPERVARYLALVIGTSLLSLASPIVRSDEDAVTESQPTVADAQPFKMELASRSAPARAREPVTQPPSPGEQKEGRQVGVVHPERMAHARAIELAAAMKPKVAHAFALIRATIARAASQDIVRVVSVSDPSLPEPLMMSTAQLGGRSRLLAGSGLVIRFHDDRRWNVYVEVGTVEVSGVQVEQNAGAVLSYPMLQITEEGITLATVGFDQQSADLTVSTRSATSPFAQSLDMLKQEYQDEELVANAILDLLQDATVRRAAL